MMLAIMIVIMIATLAMVFASGCGWDLLALGKNLDGSTGGLVDTVLAAGEDLYIADAAAGTGTKVKPQEDGQITGVAGVSEDGGLLETAVRLNTSPNYVHRSHQFQGGQTEEDNINKRFARVNRPVRAAKDRIIGSLTNAAAKMDAILVIVGKGGVNAKFSAEPYGELPPGTSAVSATMATTATADEWTEGDVSFESYEIEDGGEYEVLGAVADGATLMAIRFVSKHPDEAANRPGIIGGDTDQLNAPTYFSHPFKFNGDTGLRAQILCHAGDTATRITLIMRKIR